MSSDQHFSHGLTIGTGTALIMTGTVAGTMITGASAIATIGICTGVGAAGLCLAALLGLKNGAASESTESTGVPSRARLKRRTELRRTLSKTRFVQYPDGTRMLQTENDRIEYQQDDQIC